MKIYNSEKWIEEQKGKRVYGRIYDADTMSLVLQSRDTAEAKGKRWFNSSERQNFLDKHDLKRKALLNSKMANAATGYDPAMLRDFVADTMMDIGRTALDYPNYLATMYNVVSKPGQKGSEIKLRDLLRPIVKGKEFNGSGDLPPIMEHRLGNVEEVPLRFFGFGDKSAIREIIQSPNYDLVTEAAAVAIVNSDNDLVFGPMVGATYDPAHSQLFDTTGVSQDVKIYNTIKGAVKKAIQLKNPLTGRVLSNGSYEVVLYLNKYDALDVVPVIQGNVTDANGAVTKYAALPIDTVVEYNGAEDNGASYMGSTLNFTGVPAGNFFVLIKARDGAQLVKVVDWTMDADSGNARIKGDEKYWWNYGGNYNANILPTTQGGEACGAIVKGFLS
ncbi:MAG: hypothetical protein LBP76_09460 [Treponema sp.]|jgi:hypothetical protein|nr:hypothetical protein [Treponema sp.]